MSDFLLYILLPVTSMGAIWVFIQIMSKVIQKKL